MFLWRYCLFTIFFFNDTATTEIYTLSLHDALPILRSIRPRSTCAGRLNRCGSAPVQSRSEEHTSELQSQSNLVCRLLLEKKKKIKTTQSHQYNTIRLTESKITLH